MKNITSLFAKQVILGTTLCSALLIPAGCEEPPSPECTNALANLTCNLALTGAAAALGVPFQITSVIPNVITTIQDCRNTGADAEASTARFSVSRQNTSGGYDPASFRDYNVGGIAKNSEAENKITTTFNAPGIYKIVSSADFTNNVVEAKEDDNGSNEITQDPKNKSVQSLIIEVLPNPGFIPRENAPIVEIDIEPSVIKPIGK